MRTQHAVIALFSLSILVLQGSVALAANKVHPAPNVIVFLIDDLGWTDLGCYGSTFYETPNIDKLAARGIRFTSSYSGHPVCSPTRASLMTGKAPQRDGITDWIHQPSSIHLPAAEFTVGEAFQAAGYKTGYIGKWHLGEKDNQLPTSNGFAWMRCVNRGGQPASYFYPYRRKSKRGSYWDVPDLEGGKKGDYLTDALTDKALEFIESNRTRPFFLYFAHYAVHTPLQAPKKLIEKYQAKKKRIYGDSKTGGIPEKYGSVSRNRQDNPVYAAMIERLDTNIGRVLDKLDELELTNNTIILFTSDNGGLCTLRRHPGPTCNLPLRAGKGWNFQGGVRIPTIFSWPGHIKPGTCDIPIISMDMYPTLLALTGQPLRPKQHIDGRSLLSAIEGRPDASLRERIFGWTYPHNHGSGHRPSSAIQKGGWKLIHFDSDNTNELYNIAEDIGEKKDLAAKYPERTKAMLAELNRWLEETTLYSRHSAD